LIDGILEGAIRDLRGLLEAFQKGLGVSLVKWGCGLKNNGSF